MKSKFDREWFRGASAGYEAAREHLAKYGKAHVQHGADQLRANLRKRNEAKTSFDQGYTAAFVAMAYDENPWHPNGSHNSKGV